MIRLHSAPDGHGDIFTTNIGSVVHAAARFALCMALAVAIAPAEPIEADGDAYRNWTLLSPSGEGPGTERLGVTPSPRFQDMPVLDSPIDLSISRLRPMNEGGELAVTTVSGLLDFSFFGVTTVTVPDVWAMGGPEQALPPEVFSFGMTTGMNPSGGSLNWAGIVVGADNGSGAHGTMIIGRVGISIPDFMDPKADITMDSLFDFGSGNSLDPIMWSGVTVSDGAFSSAMEGSSVQGRFYGFGQEEAGGTFESHGIRGAFGATRMNEMRLMPEPEPDLSEPTNFIAAFTQAALIGDLTLTGPAAATPEAGLPVFADEVVTLTGIQALGGLGFPSTTIAWSGTLAGDGTREGQLDWAASVPVGLLDPEMGFVASLNGQFNSTPAGYTLGGEISISTAEGPAGPSQTLLTSSVELSRGMSQFVTPSGADSQWMGSLTGRELNPDQSQGNPVGGNVTLSLMDGLSAGLDVELTNMTGNDTTDPDAGMAWSNVTVANGIFRSSDVRDVLFGFISGPSGGAMGVFERDGVAGTFTAGPRDDSAMQAPRASFDVMAVVDAISLDPMGQGAMGAFARNPALISRALNDAMPAMSMHNGITLSESHAMLDPSGDGAASFEVFGGWLEHSYFATVRVHTEQMLVGSGPALSMAATLGMASGMNPPSGSARWEGAMLGIDTSGSSRHGNLIRGVATIMFEDMSYANVDVMFSEVMDMTADSSRHSMAWYGIPVHMGSFAASVGEHRVQGQFFGPMHEEVAGTFHWQDILGSFGAMMAP